MLLIRISQVSLLCNCSNQIQKQRILSQNRRNMGVVDLITRVDSICKKYEKYDIDKQREVNGSGDDDAFSRLYSAIESAYETLLQKTEELLSEKNRAKAVAMNAEIRRTKARLLEGIPKLQRLAFKKVKGISKEEIEARNDLVLSLRDKIEAIPEGSAAPVGGWAASTSYSNIRFDANVSDHGSEYFQQTEESDQFKQEYQIRKTKQDQGLDYIAEGLETLKNMAQDINEELDRQEPLMDEMDTKIDKAATDLKSTNVRLKDTVTKLRSSRNFCIDIILLCIILGIAAFIYNSVK